VPTRGSVRPGVQLIRPDVWCIPVPLPLSRIRHVFVYVLAADDGVYLIDAGWDTPTAMAALADGLAVCGASLSDVRGIVVTHAHPDHFGLAAPVRERTGAWVALHRDEADLASERYRSPAVFEMRIARMLSRFGVPVGERTSMAMSPILAHRPAALDADVLLEDADRLPVRCRDVRVVLTRGHTPGHIGLWDECERLFMSGDCILPRVRSSLTFDPDGDGDPLGDQLRSLELIERLDAVEVLPAHVSRFDDVTRRMRQVRRHHVRRCAEVLEAVASGAETAWEVGQTVRKRRWSEMDGRRRRAVLVDAAVHLRHLVRGGRLRESVRGDVIHWSQR
jgi:glyoxylase-like metal-dependent hydrolase (beta-lactamase superfamily II)